MPLKVFLGALATVIALLGYIPYLRDIFLGKTKPHAFTWLVWASLTAIAFAGQVVDNAGPGAWVTGFTALVSFFIFGTALFRGEKNITKSDWASLIGAAVALALWFITKEPLLSVILITIIDALGFIPTIRKSFHKPGEETLITYLLSGIKFVIALFALETYTIVTWLYPASLVLANGFFVLMLMIRRKQIATPQTPSTQNL